VRREGEEKELDTEIINEKDIKKESVSDGKKEEEKSKVYK